MLKEHITEEAIIQLLYIYSFNSKDLEDSNEIDNTLRNIKKIYEALKTRNLYVLTFEGIADKKDAVLTYQKTRR